MNRYETVFIVTPVLSEAQTKEAVSKFEKNLKDGGAKLIETENWGLKKLAYSIQKKSTGFYFLIDFECEPSVIEKYEVELRRDERILRFLTVKMDKFHSAFADKRRKKLKGTLEA